MNRDHSRGKGSVRRLLRFIGTLTLATSLGCFSGPLREEDRPALLTVEDLAAYDVRFDDHERYEKFERTIYLDRSIDLDYEFELPDDAEEGFYMTVTAGFERTRKDARTSYALLKGGFTAVTKFGGVDVVEADDPFRYGDESFFGFLENDGKKMGNLFVARKGIKTYMVVIVGIYFDQPEMWGELVGPYLEYVEGYDP